MYLIIASFDYFMHKRQFAILLYMFISLQPNSVCGTRHRFADLTTDGAPTFTLPESKRKTRIQKANLHVKRYKFVDMLMPNYF